jgi:hypothetical protein
MNRHLIRRLPAAVIAGGLLLFTAASIGAQTAPTLTLVLHGGTQAQMTKCHDPLHSYQGYKIGSTLQMDAYITPAPAGTWHAKFKVKKCKLGKWVTVWQRKVLGHGTVVNGVAEGHIQGSYKPRAIGLYRVKAEYDGYTPQLVSDYQHFFVHK